MKTLLAYVLTLATLAWSLPALAQDKKDETGLAGDAELVETRTEVPKLKAAAEYKMKDGVLNIELSEYAGYAGLIAANCGMEPNDNSIFAKKYGFKVKLTLSEEESWSSLNSGQLGAAATTVDVLAVYGRQFEVVTPLLIGFSRGADGVVVSTDVKRVNDLRGKTVASCQFTEADFFLRYLAQEAGLSVNMLPDLATKPAADKINVVYCADAFGAGDLFLRDLKAGKKRLAGCVTWAPKTNEVAEGSRGKATVLVSNRNLLIVADILVVNKPFAKANPKIVDGLVQGILEGNAMVRAEPDKYLDVVGKPFKWNADKTKSELAKVHLANLPENSAFFAGTLDSAGGFGYIYETANYVYGKDLIGKAFDGEKFLDLAGLKSAAANAVFKDQKASITPLKSKQTSVEGSDNPILSKDIRFFFKPNSSKLEANQKENVEGLEGIRQMLRVSPGSTVLLRGHADGSLVAGVRKDQGENKAREMMISLKTLSKSRCQEIKDILQEKFGIDASRIESQGVGAEEPTGKGPDADRRVEVQWFTVE
jgi:NitT/TauT family transport system substrate-binding protein